MGTISVTIGDVIDPRQTSMSGTMEERRYTKTMTMLTSDFSSAGGAVVSSAGASVLFSTGAVVTSSVVVLVVDSTLIVDDWVDVYNEYETDKRRVLCMSWCCDLWRREIMMKPMRGVFRLWM